MNWIADHKTCVDCKETKPIEAFRSIGGRFRKNRKPYVYHYCADCDRKKKARMFRLRKFGITYERYQEMLAEQGHRCGLCRKPFKEHGNAPCVDHCHHTGRVRSVLCYGCNTAIGLLGDDPAMLLKAARYLMENAANGEGVSGSLFDGDSGVRELRNSGAG